MLGIKQGLGSYDKRDSDLFPKLRTNYGKLYIRFSVPNLEISPKGQPGCFKMELI